MKLKRGAFTLVELLVVITLIALMAMLLIPSFSSAMTMYRATQCRNNLKHLWEGFVLASDPKSSGEGILAVRTPDSAGLYPTGMIWPTVPRNVLEDIRLYQCPEDEVFLAKMAELAEEGSSEKSLSGSLASVEYVSPYGHYPLDTIGNGNCYKSRRGRDAKGPYTEYLMQDDEGTGGQYAQMSFTGWIDTDGGARIYDSGEIQIFSALIADTAGCVPAWSGNHGPGWPNGINTCGNINSIWYMGEPSLIGNGKMQDARGNSYMLLNWGERMTNYGINSYAYTYSSGSGCIVLVDYQEPMVNVDTALEAEGMLLQSARHFDNVNYLLSDGAVKTASPLEISPRIHIGAWRP